MSHASAYTLRVLLMWFLIGASSAAALPPVFDTFRTYRLGDTSCILCVTAMATADLDGDGSLDVVASVQTPVAPFLSSIVVALGNSGGQFTSWTRHTVSAGTEPYAIALGDFNGDGHVDACTANLSTNNLSILQGAGAGSFAWSHNVATLPLPDGLAVGDLNNDGFQDLFVTSLLNGAGQVMLGNGAGSFTQLASIALPGSPANPVLADLDGNGSLDVVLTASMLDQVHVLFGDGLGGLAPTATLPQGLSAGDNPQDVIVVDLNGDSFLDIATANSSSSDVVIHFGDGTGGFPTHSAFAAGALVSTLHASDLDGDTVLDLVVASTFDGEGSILRGTGGGQFVKTADLDVGQMPLQLTSDDVDADGDQDLIVLLGINAIATVLGDGTGAVQQPVYLPSGSAPVSVAVGDVNGDGTADVVAVNEDRELVVHRKLATGDYTTQSFSLAPHEPTEIQLADLDGDLDLDAVILQGTQGTIVVLGGDGQGGFTVAGTVAAGFSLRALTLVDMNGDSAIDVVALDPGNDALLVVAGDGAGLFAPAVTYAVTDIPAALTVGDYNGDSALDAVVLTQGTLTGDPRVYFLAGTTAGTLLPAVIAQILPDIGFEVASGDFNADGFLDIAATTAQPDPKVRLLTGDGGGGFSLAGTQEVGGGIRALLSADFDGDQHPEIVTLSILETPLAVMQASNGGFDSLDSFGVGAWPNDAVAADLDGDGQLDLAVACRDSGTVALLLNRTQGGPLLFTRGDVSGEGSVAINDAVLLLGYLFQPGVTVDCLDAADIDDDGVVNLLDGVLLLNALFVPAAAPPAAPYPGCGVDPSTDALTPCPGAPPGC